MDTFDPKRDQAASASPKLDGVHAKANRSGLFFKGGAPIPGRDKLKASIAEHFRRNPDAPEVAGELYNHGEKFERIIAKAKTGGGRLGFHVFPGQSGPALRGHGVHHVAEKPVKSSGDLDSLHKAHLKSGYEGSVIRTAGGNLVKHKPLRDAEFPVVSAIPGKRGKASLVLRHGKTGETFRAQTTSAIAAKVKAGQPATVAYHGETEKGKPRSGVVKAIRDYEGPVKQFAVVEEPIRNVARAVCIRGEQILASRDEFGRYWLPGGGQEKDEGPAKAALRELKEETGYSGRVVRYSGDWDDETSIRGVVVWRNDTTGGNLEHTTFIHVRPEALGRSAPEPGEEKHRYRWWPISMVEEVAQNPNDERGKMLETRRRAIRESFALTRSDTQAKGMKHREFSYAPAGPNGEMVRLPDHHKPVGAPAAQTEQKPAEQPGFFRRNRSKILVGAAVAGVLAFRNRSKGKYASTEELAKAAARGDNFGGAHRPANPANAVTFKKLEAIGRIAELNIIGEDGFRAVASVKGAIRSAKPVVTWTKRGAEVAQDADDMASGRPLNKKPFYQKAWFKNAALTTVVAGGIYGGRKLAQNRTQIPVPGIVANTPVGAGIRKLNDRHAKGQALFETIRENLVEFDALAEEKGWDLRDARGKSARVFAPGSQRRDRREKTPWEKADTQRAVRNGLAVVAAGGLAATGVLAYQNRNLRRAVTSTADQARKGIQPIMKDKAGAIVFKRPA